MVKEEKKPFGYIYQAINQLNGKKYIGQTVTSVWSENKVPIEARWKQEIGEAYAKQRRGESLRYIEYAIIKYGEENFKLKEQDTAHNQEDLDNKETHYIKKYDTMNREKGYNMKEGGRGGRLSEMAKEKLSNIITEKYQKDPEYYKKQVEERRERAKNPDWINKMTEVNQEIARNPEYQKNMSEAISSKWQEKEYQVNVSEGVTSKWQETKFRERQSNAKINGRREIPDKREFLQEIQNWDKKDINRKYDMDGKCINDRIEEMLGHHGIKNFSQAKKYLEDKNLDDVFKDVTERVNSLPESLTRKKEISDKKAFLEDIQNMQSRELAQKYEMNRSTMAKRIREMLGDQGIKNYTEAKNYLEGKNLDEVVKDINEMLSDQSHITEGTTIIENKQEFLKDIQELQKNEIDHKYGMDAKTINNKIKEILGEKGVNNYTEAREYLKDKNLEDVAKDIDKQSDEKQDNQSEEPDEEKKEEKPEDLKEGVDKDEKQSESPPEKESNKPSEKLGKGKEFGMKLKPVREKDTHRQRPKESRAKESGSKTPILTSGIRQKQAVQRGSKDYDGIDRAPSRKWIDYKGIDRNLDSNGDDIKGLGGGKNDKGRDYDGIDKPQEKKGKDYVKLEDNYGEGRYEG